MVYLVSHIEGRTRLKFPDLYEKESFITNVKDIKGLKKLDGSDGQRLTVLVEYEPKSPFEYLINQIISKEPEPKLTKDDISSYVSPLLTSPITKALWLMTVLGGKVGFLQTPFYVNSIIKWTYSTFTKNFLKPFSMTP